ncbi:MAG: tRNA lysidine(34) synthetase TilS [Novosphingobium sp.]|nr:tRNA lysidine(34) synthetase TilS [Novosphingobium sp.]
MAPAGACPAHPDLPAADSEPVRRFLAGLEKIWPEGFERPDARLGLAVSGGPDSCALLLLAASALPGRIAAATVDHGLRAESADEARFVAELCAALEVPHSIDRVTVGAGNVQAQARTARYAALGDWARQQGLHAVATAHHADDQAETLLMRLSRASGVAGLAGVRARGAAPLGDLVLLRPLLDWRREDLARIVDAAGVTAVADPSNLDDRFDRVRLRKALADADWLDPLALAQSAAHLSDADEALDWAARREWNEAVQELSSGLVYRCAAPRAVAIRVIARIVQELDGGEPRGGQLAILHDRLDSGLAASIGSLVAKPQNGAWTFSKATKRRQSSD